MNMGRFGRHRSITSATRIFLAKTAWLQIFDRIRRNYDIGITPYQETTLTPFNAGLFGPASFYIRTTG
jgi:hypothetical protein